MAEAKLAGDVKAVVWIAAFLVVGASFVGDTTLTLVLSLPIIALLSYAMMKAPIRQSMLALMFFAFVLQNPAEGNPTERDNWAPPLHTLGAIMLTHLNAVDRSIGALSWCSFSGLDLCFFVLGITILYRKNTGSKIDISGSAITPRPLFRLALVALGGAAYVWITGLARGGDFSMSLWQLNAVMYLPVVFLLFQAGLRGPKDHQAIARVVLAAATYKALLALYIKVVYPGVIDPETGESSLVFVTTHADSILFADAFILIVAALLERVGGRTKWLALILLPILAGGMIVNNRRLVWVQVALVFITVYIVAEDNPAKRFIRRSLVAVTPIIAVYLAVGWNAGGAVFKPVRMLRSVVDTQTDASSLWRELENYDIITTIQAQPVFGTGFGHPYTEYTVLPEVGYSLERYVPHNGILGLWCYCGYFGYAALSMLWAGGVYFAMRSYHGTKDPTYRAAALVSFGTILVYLVQAWGDLGLSSWTGVFSAGAGLAVAGKLCVATGQWPSKSGNRIATSRGDNPKAVPPS